ncbi:MAG: polyprenyl diphosphate synthase [Aquificaceae bacterium]|nr:polyprenyl diphosphate synthase [Aquificaceae bacterium]MDW8237803.1 polyprenyl diphosphate synthase [Aquificaceae bacterium]
MKLPKHLAVIMDGNGRWASERGLPRVAGHYEGVKRAEELLSECLELGIRWVTLFVFSTENWKRPMSEVQTLFGLLERYIIQNSQKLLKLGIKSNFIGRRDRIPKSLESLISKVESTAPEKIKLELTIALDYGGRDEIIRAINKILKSGYQSVDEKTLREHMDLPKAPDPDLLIRTAGEMRLSNFLLFNLAYTELYFTHTYWPDFTKEELYKALEEFSKRERRFGAVRKV